ncbi:MAG TPA: AgmX/PglI C-terminal domain-containing protein [Myxococcota bacterium]|nr:AgmX/PglI C-terminal domain-containing protein [Myxococcota bacterium]HRY95031.1 AgmX/PglI C-terminal domain-containing protein [Myxococcota bacterium]
MSETNRAKILRVGVVQGGKIIEEKLVRKRASITVGSSTKNTLILTAAGVPRSLSLFEVKGSDYYLCFSDQIQGRVSVGDQAASDLQSLKAQKLVRQVGDTFQLRLTESHRGRVELGEVIILFQFVTPPPEPARPQLPASVKGYWMRNIDWPYTSTLAALFACLAVLSIWSKYVPLPSEDLALEDIPDRFAKMVMPDKEMDLPADDGAGDKEEPEPTEDKAEKDEPDKTPAEGDEAARAAAAARKRADMEKKVSGRGLLKILGAKGPSGFGAGSAVADVFGEGSGDSGDGAFDGIGGIDVATTAGEKGIRGGGDGGEAATIADMGTRGVVDGAGTGTKAKAEARVVAKVSSAALEDFDSDSRSREDIKKVVQRRVGGIKSCYEARLKRNPELKGKVVVKFVIHPGGKVLEADVIENTTGDSDLAACIAAKVKSIRFPAAEGGETVVTYPFILAPV